MAKEEADAISDWPEDYHAIVRCERCGRPNAIVHHFGDFSLLLRLCRSCINDHADFLLDLPQAEAVQVAAALRKMRIHAGTVSGVTNAVRDHRTACKALRIAQKLWLKDPTMRNHRHREDCIRT